MSRLQWYWHRLRAMSPGEVAGHARKKFFQLVDERRERDWTAVKLESPGTFPKLPEPKDAPEALREALKRDVENILAGRWKAFGHLDIKVDDPPLWHCDYLVGKDLATAESAFKLNHRELPDGADIKLIWELSRWYQLVRLAMAAYVLGDARAAQKCVSWLNDWVKHNPPYRGWNWTSALEVGMRLVQFTWIDALLSASAKAGIGPPSPRPSPPGEGEAAAVGREGTTCQHTAAAGLPLPGGEGRGEGERWQEELARLRYEILPAHVWFAWRYKSFGSSANNHLIGELAGLILATVRWPALAQWGAPLKELQRRWENEVLVQFAEDGGNKEQALNYQLFSWEFCWQARMALLEAGRKISPRTDERLDRAARFFWEVQARHEPWDYGDSDNAFVIPFFASEQTLLCEWRDWFSRRAPTASLAYWLGDAPAFYPQLGFGEPNRSVKCKDWWVFKDTGIAICESGFWWLRWDLSPLGYLSTAAHGHLDALHLSIWFRGVALIIDPGTGAYYADTSLRNWLASRAAHNGPCPTGKQYPQRSGSFLWAAHHLAPVVKDLQHEPVGVLNLPERQLRRRLKCSPAGLSWVVEDSCVTKDGRGGEFTVRWQFAPNTWIKMLAPRKYSVNRAGVSIVMEVDQNWTDVRLVETEADRPMDANSYEGTVSPSFRRTIWAPYLKLTAAGGDKPCVFRTAFLASDPS